MGKKFQGIFMRRAFTLLELSYVLALLGILIAVMVPSYDQIGKRAKAAEAEVMLFAIAHAEGQYFRDHGSFLACAPSGEIPRDLVAFPNHEPCWKALMVQSGAAVRYRYSVSLEGGSFLAVAEGDLDRDGITSRFTLRGRDLHLEVADRLE